LKPERGKFFPTTTPEEEKIFEREPFPIGTKESSVWKIGI
jgi:hypothetical protein